MNQGLSETRGDLFAYLGSDDIWMPRKLKIQEEQLSAEPRAVLAYSPKFYVDAQGMVTGRSDTWGRNTRGGDLSEDIVRCRSFPQVAQPSIAEALSAMAGTLVIDSRTIRWSFDYRSSDRSPTRNRWVRGGRIRPTQARTSI
ncbi:MAG: glycosyltransferase family 2 protein [Sandaracinaceae bacterium]|nr:glycosyltransferase family 2 protein [Sandaracinaceae bacterium]